MSLRTHSGSGGSWWASEFVTSLPGWHPGPFFNLPGTPGFVEVKKNFDSSDLSHVRTTGISLLIRPSLLFLSISVIPANSFILLILSLGNKAIRKIKIEAVVSHYVL